MRNVTKVIAAVISFATLLAQVPAVQQAVVGFFSAHPSISIIVGGVGAILALFHVPKQ